MWKIKKIILYKEDIVFNSVNLYTIRIDFIKRKA